MANKVGYILQLQDRFSAQARRISQASEKIQKNMDKTGVATSRASRIVSKSSSLMKSKVAAVGAAIGALVTGGGILTAGGRFQTAMADLQALTGAAGKDLDSLADSAMNLGKRFAISQDQLATAFKLVAGAKPELLENTDALKQMTEQMLLLSTAGGIEVAEAAKISGIALNVYGKSAKDAAELVNLLAAGAKFGASEIADTGEALKIAAPNARDAGVSLLSLNAAIQATALGGIKASQAGTALSAIFGRLRRKGIDVGKVGLERTFEFIGEQLNKTNSDFERATLSMELFGEEHGKVGLALVSNAKKIAELERKLKGTNVAQEQAGIRLNTFGKRWERLKVILSGVFIKIFNKIEPTLSKIVERMSDFFDSLDDAQLSKFGENIATIVNAFANLVSLIAKTINLIEQLFRTSDAGSKALERRAATASRAQAARQRALGAGERGIRLGEVFEGFSERQQTATTISGRRARRLATPSIISAPNQAAQESKTDLNINIKAPRDTVKSVTRRDRGRNSGLNIGTNMELAL